MTVADRCAESPQFRHCYAAYRKHYKKAYLWTIETGCLVFTSFIIYYLTFVSSREGRWLDRIVTFLFVLGALAYVALSKVFRKLNALSQDNVLLKFLKSANKWVFVGLSFLPGIYFAFQYEEFILRFYMVIHLVTSSYFFYKRLREFELIPFLIGLGMSFALGSIGPSIRFFFALFGSGWFPTTCASTLETIIDLSLAVAFMLRLPEKYLPSSMIFGLKVVKYLMFFFSWKTFFILMVIASWKNIGSGTETVMELYFNPPELPANETKEKHKEGPKHIDTDSITRTKPS